ncbi:MAG: cytochrome P450 [Burkholderiales bacterium]|nr:cytochrome P450 [Burkholderiales bacterium]
MSEIDYRPEDPEILANPYPLYERMRREDPVHWSPRLKSWVLTRYDDVRRVCLEPERMSSDRLRPFFASLPSEDTRRIADIIRYLSLWMVFKDPPEHTRLRRLASRVFHNRSMQAMRPQVEAIAGWLLDRIDGRAEFDFIAEFAGPLPCLVIMAMLGVPREDLAGVKRMSDEIALFIGSSRTSSEKYATAEAATREMADYFRRQIALRRREPGSDLLSELVHLDDAGDRLSEDELVAMCILLLFAGHETTTNHLANGLLSLMQFPGEQRKLRADPSRIAAAVEELLRHEGPSGAQVRIVKQSHELRGRQLTEGDRVFLLLNAANRDPEAYAEPDRLDIDRDEVPHLAFGFGLHICLGFPLARLEGQVAFPAVLARYRSIVPTGPAPEWINSLVFRGMKALPVAVDR